MGKQPPKFDPEAEITPNRQPGMRALAALLPKLTGKALGKRGLAQGRIVTDWTAIVGPELAALSRPEQLIFPGNGREGGTLHLVAESAAALEMQHDEPRLVERINTYFGYRAVARLKLRQGPVAPPPDHQPAVEPTPAEIAAAEAATAAVGDEAVRGALRRLGQSLMARERADKNRPTKLRR